MTTPAAPEKSDLSETQMERIAVKIEQREATNPRSRHIEDALAVAGIIQALFYGTLEGLRSAGFTLGTCTTGEHSFPWVTVIIFLGCVLPKTVGRATAGRVWDSLGQRIGVGK